MSSDRPELFVVDGYVGSSPEELELGESLLSIFNDSSSSNDTNSFLVKQHGNTCGIASQNFILKRFNHWSSDTTELEYLIDSMLGIGIQEDETNLMYEATLKGYFNPIKGTPDKYLGSLLDDHGIPVTQLENSNFHDLSLVLSSGKLVMVSLDAYQLPDLTWQLSRILDQMKKNTRFPDDPPIVHGKHIVVVDKVVGNTVILADSGTGRMLKVPKGDFEKAWNWTNNTMIYTNYSPQKWRSLLNQGIDSCQDSPSNFKLD